MKLWNIIQMKWKKFWENVRFVMYLDMRALDDPSHLTGEAPSPETKKMVQEAAARAGIVREDHNGWHAYRRILDKLHMTWDLHWYARPYAPTHYLTIGDLRQRIVTTIENDYSITLMSSDKLFLMNMKTPHEMCVDFPNRFNPRHYPALVSDYSDSVVPAEA